MATYTAAAAISATIRARKIRESVIPTVLVHWEMTGEKHPILDVGDVQEAPWR